MIWSAPGLDKLPGAPESPGRTHGPPCPRYAPSPCPTSLSPQVDDLPRLKAQAGGQVEGLGRVGLAGKARALPPDQGKACPGKEAFHNQVHQGLGLVGKDGPG